MEQQLTPVEARGGVVSGRTFLVLVSSLGGAVVAVALCRALFLSYG